MLFYFARAELAARDVAIHDILTNIILGGEKMSCFIMSIILELPLGYHQT